MATHKDRRELRPDQSYAYELRRISVMRVPNSVVWVEPGFSVFCPAVRTGFTHRYGLLPWYGEVVLSDSYGGNAAARPEDTVGFLRPRSTRRVPLVTTVVFMLRLLFLPSLVTRTI